MAIYGYRCPHCSDIEVAFPIGTATAAVPCPDCGATSVRVFSTPMLARTRPPCRLSCSARSAAPPSPRSSPPCRDAAARAWWPPIPPPDACRARDRSRAERNPAVPELIFPLDSTKKIHRPGQGRPQPVASRDPAGRRRQAGRQLPGPLPGVVRRPDRQRRRRRGHPRRPADDGARAQRPVRRRGGRAGRPAGRGHPRRGVLPQEDSGPLAGQGWGTPDLRQERRRLLTEEFPDAYKAIWDFQAGRDVAPHPGGVVHRAFPSWSDGHRAVGGAAGQLNTPGGGR